MKRFYAVAGVMLALTAFQFWVSPTIGICLVTGFVTGLVCGVAGGVIALVYFIGHSALRRL